MSIGLPVYNGERYLRRALDCLLAQDYPHFELLISDNASTDQTRQICEEYGARDARINFKVNQSNAGIIANFQLVLDRARGKYFMWAAHDDTWDRRFVGVMVHELETHPGAAVAMSGVERVHENGTPHDVVRHADRTNPNRMNMLQLALALAEGSPHHLFIYGLFRTEFLRQAFHNFPRVIAADRLMMIQAALSARFRYVDAVLHTRYINEEPIPVRYQNDEFGQAWHDRHRHLKKDLALGPYLFRSRMIPWQRKFWIPLIVIWPLLKRLYHGRYRFLCWLAGKIMGRGGRRKNIARYLRRLVHMGSR
ncbi:MAG TPA: glycosyltransferase family 2 protein [Pyrinomonadaceae bacterium]|nr:glycosyltransferase family 2 protein [Pyrinomonadaceae bacterium]